MRYLLLVVGAIGLCACGSSAPTSSSPAASDKPAAPAATATPAPKAKAAPAVLLDVSGAGAKKSQIFAASGDWDLTWTAKDTSGAGACYMGIIVYDAATNTPSGVAVNQQVSGQGGDVDHEHKGGRYYLDVNAANCAWTAKVTG